MHVHLFLSILVFFLADVGVQSSFHRKTHQAAAAVFARPDHIGLGAVEAALTAGLTAAGLPGAVALSSVLLYRLLTFWLPVPIGWVALKYLERQQAL